MFSQLLVTEKVFFPKRTPIATAFRLELVSDKEIVLGALQAGIFSL